MKRRPSKIAPEALALHWNTAYAVGIEVDLREDDGRITRTTTRSAAWVLGGHTAVIEVDGRSGCYRLDRLTPVLKEAA